MDLSGIHHECSRRFNPVPGGEHALVQQAFPPSPRERHRADHGPHVGSSRAPWTSRADHDLCPSTVWLVIGLIEKQLDVYFA